MSSPDILQYQTIWNEEKTAAATRKADGQSSCFGFKVDGSGFFVVWREESPLEVIEIGWTNEYGIYATKTEPVNGKNVVVDVNFPAKLGHVYEWNGTEFKVTALPTDEKAIVIRNATTDKHSFGISKKNKDTGKLDPISIDTIFPNQGLEFTPNETVIVITGKESHLSMIIDSDSAVFQSGDQFVVEPIKPHVYDFNEASSHWVEQFL